ncbi:DUF222 domain-containing protein [Ornithinimicrobium sp. Y1694]|uniref:HNH endonuclease signature motif containing protein n=2 Tax=Ornithinimicrobium sp. Y1694 TaxID=3418590 RepID=UPI003CF24898
MKQQGFGGEVLRMAAGAVTGAPDRAGAAVGLPASSPPSVVLSRALRESGREALLAERASAGSVLLMDADVVEALDSVAVAERALVTARVRLACEVAERGLHVVKGFGLVDWLSLRCPDLEASGVRDLARLATACTEAVHAPVLEGVLDEGMSVARAAKILRVVSRVRSALSPEQYAALVEALAGVGADPAKDDKAMKNELDEVLRRCISEKDQDEANKARRGLRNVHESSLADGSVKRLIWTFGDDADYEAVRAILNSPLAAPASKEEVEATGQEDLRTAGQRRYDALMMVIGRGVAGSKGQPSTPKAMVMVSIDFEVLKRMLSETGEDEPGCGATLDGASVSADSIRRLACDAGILPVVLGTQGQILDMGEQKRLATYGQRVALAKRDKGCSIPGCTIPASWCEAHHVIWWSRGGLSDLDNYALLCPRHHTWVHDNELTATVTTFGVTWHLK